MSTISTIGAGSWGTALSIVLARAGHQVRLWGRDSGLIREIADRRENAKYLPGGIVPESVAVTADEAAALAGADVVLFVVPSVGLRDIVRRVAPHVPREAVVVSASKGLESDTGKRLTEVIAEELPVRVHDRLVALSGPNLAVEVVRGVPTAAVVASTNRDAAVRVQDLFSVPLFRVYTSTDVAGVELGGALKNIIAIGAGINDGLGYGDNTKAALCTRGLVEMARLAVALGGRPETLSGLAGVGDLMATCVSRQSRNWNVGHKLGLGQKTEDILAGMVQIAEGIPTTRAAKDLAAKLGIEMPITEQLYEVIYHDKPAPLAVGDLMSRDRKDEMEHLADLRELGWDRP